MKWLYKLEYKHGNRALRNMMIYIVAGMVLVYALDMLMPGLGLMSWLALIPQYVLQGQVWRLITFIFVPTRGLFWLVFYLYFYYTLGNMLESVWGSFRLNLYYLLGIIFTILSAFVVYFVNPTYAVTNMYLNLSLFLAVAVVAPDTQFMFFFLVPIKAKWLALINVGLNVINIVNAFQWSVNSGWCALIVFGFSLANFLLFFGQNLVKTVQNQFRVLRNRRNWRNNR
jgi:membrane associated rhomboid family serine protease